MISPSQIIQRLRRLISTPINELNNAQRSMRYGVDLARYCAVQLRRDRATQMAAALTYHTLFSLLPTLVLMLVVLASFPGLEEERSKFQARLIKTVLPSIKSPSDANESPVEVGEQKSTAPADDDHADTSTTRDNTPPAEPDGSPEPSPAPGADHQSNVEQVAQARELLAEKVAQYMTKLENLNFGSIGVIGVLVFITAATALLTTIERSFNVIYAVTRSRPWYMRLPLYYTSITLAPLMLMAGQFIQQSFLNVLRHDMWPNWLDWLAGLMTGLSPVLSTWLVFFALFVLMPATKVAPKAAAVGSFVSALAWVIGHELFSAYVTNAGTVTIYGALALLPLLLFWLWLTWLIILFGLELSYVLQTLRGRQQMEEQAQLEANVLGDPLWLLPIMAGIGKAFGQGEPIAVEKLADDLRLPVRTVATFNQRLEEQGLIHQVHRDGRNEAEYALALPPDRIELTRLLELGRSFTSVAREDKHRPGWSMLDRLAKVQAEASEKMTLSQLIHDEDDAS